MKNQISLLLGIVFLASVFFSQCTDVPLSYSTTISDQNILGIWLMGGDTTAFEFVKNEDGTANIKSLYYHRNSRKWKYDGLNSQVYFTSIYGKNKKFPTNFISFQDEDKNYYTNGKFRFIKDSVIVFREIDDSFMEKKYKKDKNGIVIFENPTKFREFVSQNIDDRNFLGKYHMGTRVDKLTRPKPKKEVASNKSKSTKRNGVYSIHQMRTTQYFTELNTWDDPGPWVSVDDKKCSAKFFQKGMRLALNVNNSEIELFGTKLRYVSKDKSLNSDKYFYKYEGTAKQHGESIGTFYLYILDGTYEQLLSGEMTSVRFDIILTYSLQIVEDFWRTLSNGDVDKIEMSFRASVW